MFIIILNITAGINCIIAQRIFFPVQILVARKLIKCVDAYNLMGHCLFLQSAFQDDELLRLQVQADKPSFASVLCF